MIRNEQKCDQENLSWLKRNPSKECPRNILPSFYFKDLILKVYQNINHYLSHLKYNKKKWLRKTLCIASSLRGLLHDCVRKMASGW